jgi:hypothetical protein
MTAHDFAAAMQRHYFGIDTENAVASLRRLADRIESGDVAVENVRVQTLASSDDFVSTLLRLRLHERREPEGETSPPAPKEARACRVLEMVAA